MNEHDSSLINTSISIGWKRTDDTMFVYPDSIKEIPQQPKTRDFFIEFEDKLGFLPKWRVYMKENDFVDFVTLLNRFLEGQTT